MKKKLHIILIMSSYVYGNSISIDNLLEKINITSYENKIYNVKNLQNNSAEKNYKRGNYNGINVNAETKYSSSDKRYKYNGVVKFGDFYINGEKYNDSEDSSVQFGLEKNLKDLFYSDDKNNLDILTLEREIDLIELKQGIETQKLNLLSLYKSYKDNQYELKFKKNVLNTLSLEMKSLKKSYSLGKIAKFDLDSVTTSYNNTKLDIEKLTNSLNKIIQRFYYEFDFDLKNLNLIDLKIKENINLENRIALIWKKELNVLELEKNILIKNVKYLKYDDRVPDFSIGVEREPDLNDNRVFVSFSKTLFNNNLDLLTKDSLLKQKEIIYNQTKKEIMSKRFEVEENYYTLASEYSVAKNKALLEETEYKIKKKENKLGKKSYNDLMESFDDYIEAQITKEKTKNALSAYIYEIIIRSEI